MSFKRLRKVKIDVSHHKKDCDDCTSEKNLVCVMDEVSEGAKKPSKKKKTAGTHTIKNFGTALDIAKAKSSSAIALAWRCRLLLLTVCATCLRVSGCNLWNCIPKTL